jgi:spermidine/putrescine transport system ATP-binding protein
VFIRLSNVCKSFGDALILNDISLDIEAGEFHTLLGPSGCGKTTLLRLIAGFESVSSGHIHFDAEDVASRPPRERPVNTVFQSYALFPHLTVAQNVGFGLHMLKWSKPRQQEQVRKMLELVKLSGYADRLPAQLSGGQQQRVALARALAPEPQALLLDEPLSALDFQLRQEMQVELKHLHRNTGVTFILVTHDREEALALSDRISVLESGRIAQVGTPAEIYLRPATSFVASFVSNANLIATDHGSLAGLLAVRPGSIAIVRPSEGRFDATVIAAEFVGEETIVRVKTASGTDMLARVRGHSEHRPTDIVGIDWRDSDAARVER